MSESEGGNEVAREAEVKRVDRERHEKAMHTVLDKLLLPSSGYLRPGERLVPLPLEEGAPDCLASCETTMLSAETWVALRSTQSLVLRVSEDRLSHELQKAGYRVVVDYDQEKSDGEFDCLRYSLYEKEK